ncbi:MAG: 2-dehydro-3-deoxygalactonokinase [Planktotalea sp.]|uniref:2-dehydro-3-deoxygalactonokinase n=1 Tax=Planktotalea sp. TaxID=2029877 RepID=UPI003C77D442
MTQSAKITPDWIALDWGTSNLRAFAMTKQGAVLAERSSDQGMASLTQAGFEPALHALLHGWELPSQCTVVACGMVGSRQGWQEAPYCAVPCPPLSTALIRVANCSDALEVWLVPGVKQNAPADVMRGEETQIAGFLALNPDWDGVICLPGTHSKWVHVSAGEIVSFQTFMTGELFAAISAHTVLRHSLSGNDWDGDAFADALSNILSRPERLASSLFSLRAGDLLHGQASSHARAQLSGALIGAELAAAKPYWLGQNIAIIGEDRLSDLYSFALKQQGITAQRCDANAVTRAGLTAAYRSL